MFYFSFIFKKMLVTLPNGLLAHHVCGLLGRRDRLALGTSCVSCAAAAALADAQILTIALPPTLRVTSPRFFGRYPNLRVLDVGGNGDDALLRGIAGASSSLQLVELGLRGSTRITDVGLDVLAAATLTSIDICFCSNTTFAGAISLRENLPRLRVLRRQPEWLDGAFVTPFGGGGESAPEVHTYWPDGCFQFTRQEQSAGYVRGHRSYEDTRCVADVLQYIDFAPGPGWPSYSRFVYRPGVLLQRPAPGEEANVACVPEGCRTVLVYQYMAGLFPPASPVPNLRAADVPVGATIYFDEANLPIEANEEGDGVGAQPPGAYLMVSHMVVRPLPEREEGMAPEALFLRCKAFEEEAAAQENMQEFHGHMGLLHCMLTGVWVPTQEQNLWCLSA